MMVEHFYELIGRDNYIGHYFAGKNLLASALSDKLFLASVIGGEAWNGRSLE